MPLSVSISEDPTLKHLIIGVANTRHHMHTESKHFILSEEIVNVLVQNQATNRLKRKNILRPSLGSVKRVKVKIVLVIRVHSLKVELPFGVVTGSDGIIQILRCVAVVGSSDANGLFF
ncbi:hypothetical protein Ahy_A07g034855 [Arachis hypogaea]|uniref:Uncharacterized protein n=1 Tax=Arachis hypogaea TaxID=3818 RepID=A0A445CCZ7_ARAHY|nr:hypothetical protein Ahy_A07g034855 [Arachis hypogaea]